MRRLATKRCADHGCSYILKLVDSTGSAVTKQSFNQWDIDATAKAISAYNPAADSKAAMMDLVRQGAFHAGAGNATVCPVCRCCCYKVTLSTLKVVHSICFRRHPWGYLRSMKFASMHRCEHDVLHANHISAIVDTL